jgi:hypothetical protein
MGTSAASRAASSSAGSVRVIAEDVVRSQGAELRRRRVRDLRPTVPDVREPEPGRGIDVRLAVRVPDGRALAAHEDELVTVDLSHRGERVPERRRHRA